MGKKLLIVFAIGGGVAAFVWFQTDAPLQSLAKYLHKNGVEMQGVENYTITEVKKSHTANGDVTKVFAGNQDSFIHMELTENLGESKAKLYVKDKKTRLEAYFLPTPAHYPGAITQTVECPAEFHPIAGKANDIEYYLVYTSDRFSYGVCSADDVKYRSLIAFTYCPREDLVLEMQFFSTPQSFQEQQVLSALNSLGCS